MNEKTTDGIDLNDPTRPVEIVWSDWQHFQKVYNNRNITFDQYLLIRILSTLGAV